LTPQSSSSSFASHDQHVTIDSQKMSGRTLVAYKQEHSSESTISDIQ